MRDFSKGQPVVHLADTKTSAKMLCVSPRTFQRLVKQGRLPQPIRLGAAVRWRIEDILRFIYTEDPSKKTS